MTDTSLVLMQGSWRKPHSEPRVASGERYLTVTSFKPACPASDQDPVTTAGRLSRVLYVIGLNPSLKYGSLEEQIFSLALAFQKEGGLFIPLFQSPPGPEAHAM